MAQMPEDWDDHSGWESYFQELPSDTFWYEHAIKSPGSFSFDRLGSLIDEYRERNWMTIWFPGCGFSPLPRAFTLYGFHVLATDIAPSAIRYQTGNAAIVEKLLAPISSQRVTASSVGTLESKVHDFRTPMGTEIVDAIFNIKSFQGLPSGSMLSAAKSHFMALRRAGLAYFDTMNVQGTRRDQLETILTDVGFYIPVANLFREYRAALTATGIPHLFILGMPRIPQRDDMPYPHKIGTPEYERDTARLRDITDEFRLRMEAEYQREQSSITTETKHAQIIYSTG